MGHTSSGTWTVGQVAERLGVTVRTLHHYDEIGLVTPQRTWSGYRVYGPAELERLQQVVVYRRLGMPLEEIAQIVATGDAATHLRRQREQITSQIAELTRLVRAIDTALEAEMNDDQITPAEQRELFGDAFDDSYAAEAEQRWGGSDAWASSQQRAKSYSKEQWQVIAAEAEQLMTAQAEAMRSGEPATSDAAMDAVEAHRQHITRWFYDCPPALHRGLGDMYVADPRFTKTYDDVEPGLAQYVRDAIHANADRQTS